MRFNVDWQEYSAVLTGHASFDLVAEPGGNNDHMPYGGDVSIGPYTTIILSQDD